MEKTFKNSHKILVFIAALGFWIPGKYAFSACTCDPDVSFTMGPEWNGNPIAATTQVNVNLGNSVTNFVTAAYWQVYGTAPSAGTVNTQVANFTNYSWWRRVDTVNTFINAASNGSSITKVYTDPWQSETAFNTAPCKTLSRDVGAVCMFFFGCPGGVNCGMDWANTHAVGMQTSAPLLVDGGSNGIYNSGSNEGFWYLELMDARYAGLEFLMPNVYGSDMVGTNSISNLASALAQISATAVASEVKVGMFDDTSGWDASGSVSPYNTIPPMSSNPTLAAQEIANKWIAYYSQIPKNYWYTVGTTGRPLIYFYNGGTLGSTNAGEVIAQAKSDFNTSQGVTPYVVVDSFFFVDPNMSSDADNEFIWDTLHDAAQTGLVTGSNLAYSTFTFGGITVDHTMAKWDPTSRNDTNGAPNLAIATAGDGLIKNDAYFTNDLQSTQSATILTIATWNDLGEGTGINRNYDYYFNGAWQPPNQFMDEIRASQSQQSCGVTLPTLTPTPTISPTFTLTPTPAHGSLLANMETPTTNDRTLWNQGGVLQYIDSYGTTSNHSPWLTSSASVGVNGPSMAGNYAACWAGTLEAISGSAVSYSFLAFECIPGGASSVTAGGVFTSAVPYSPNQGVQFDYKAGIANTLYEVELTTEEVRDYGYYCYDFTPTDTNWHTMTVYFPDLTTAVPTFSQPPWATPVPFDATEVGAVIFQPIPQTYAVPYSLCVDNITFAVSPFSTRTPTVTPTSSPTPTVTKTATSTTSPTGTPSVSPTETGTPSFSATRTATPGNTATLTPTSTSSPTPLPSATDSLTRSPSPTGTFTTTPSSSMTASPSLTASPVQSPTDTPNGTLTDSPTYTESFTQSPTPSVTLTLTQSPTPSDSATKTTSPSPSLTPTISPSVTESSTSTLTSSPTPTLTNSPVYTATLTSTLSPVPTLTPSSTITMTATLTLSSPPTLTDTLTPQVTMTATFSYTPTGVPTVLETNTPMTSSVAPPDNGTVIQSLPAMNPQAGPTYRFAVNLSNPSASLSVRVYSRALVAVSDSTMPGMWHKGWNTVSIRVPELANGLYFVVIRADAQDSFGKPTYLMVIR